MTYTPPSPSNHGFTRFPKKEETEEVLNPKKQNVHDDQYVLFSFEYFRQQEFLGLSEQTKGYFVSLFERLKGLSGLTLHSLIHNSHNDKSLRCHPIDFERRNCPFKVENFSHVPKNILLQGRNLYQVNLSLSYGRILGAAMPGGVFSVVALDPMHNAQPSMKDGYAIQPTHIAETPYSVLRRSIEKISQTTPTCDECKVARKLAKILSKEREYSGVTFCCRIEEDDLPQVYNGIDKHSLEQVLLLGIAAIEESE